MRLVLVASDRMEFRGILARTSEKRVAKGNLSWSCILEYGGNELFLAAHGAGVQRAGEAAEHALAAFACDGIVSVGFCGALVPGLAIADIVVATAVEDGESRYAALPVHSSGRHSVGVVRTNSRVAQTVEERRALAAGGAAVVDMEASAVAKCAQSHALPFYCVKVVTDLAGERMANDFNKALRDDGRFDTIILLQGMLRQPFARLPELLRLRRRALRAANALGVFFADCRF